MSASHRGDMDMREVMGSVHLEIKHRGPSARSVKALA